MCDEWADYHINQGWGRYIEQAEVMEISAQADERNLVLQPSNSQVATIICCCCGVLQNMKRYPRPAEVVSNAFQARLDTETCSG